MQAEKIKNKEIEKLVEKNYGCKIKFSGIFYRTSKEKIWLISKRIRDVDLRNVMVNSFGLFFGRLKRNEKIQLSIEGAQIIGKMAKKNIVEIDEKNLARYLQGFDIEAKDIRSCELNNFVIVKYGEDILGTGILREGNLVENLLPKTRRVYIEIKKV